MEHHRKKRQRASPTSLPAHVFERKRAGWVFLNGNIPDPNDLVKMFERQILEPQHPDPEIDATKSVTLVTAAFDKGHEFQDRHLIRNFEELGIDAGWRGGFPTRIRNLSVWNSFDTWKRSERWLYQRYTEKQDAILAIKHDYYHKLQQHVDQVIETLETLLQDYPGLGLYELYHLDEWVQDAATVLSETARDGDLVEQSLERLERSRSDVLKARKLRRLIDHLVYKDSEVLTACKAIEGHFRHGSGLERSELYLSQREALQKTLLESATIFIYGGRVHVLMNRLRFYDLHESLRAAVTRGSNLFGISAGSVIQSSDFSIALPDASGGYQIAADEGVGLLEHIRIFPHANDYHHYVRNGSRNDLTFFALRHPGSLAVGLNQASVLLKEIYECEADGRSYLRFSSVGDDPVLVFGPRGRRYEMVRGDQLLVPGTRAYRGALELARIHEIEALEAGRHAAPSPN